MGRIVDPSKMQPQILIIPGLKPPVREFIPCDNGDPAEVDEFNKMIRNLRDQGPAVHPDKNERAPS